MVKHLKRSDSLSIDFHPMVGHRTGCHRQLQGSQGSLPGHTSCDTPLDVAWHLAEDFAGDGSGVFSRKNAEVSGEKKEIRLRKIMGIQIQNIPKSWHIANDPR